MSRAGNSFVTGLALALATPAVLADVLVVAPAGAAFTEINAAVAAAQPGDIVLVKSGTYGHVSIGNKSVSIIADAGATAEVDGIGVANLQAPNTVVLRGLNVPHPTIPELPGFSATACTGPVRVEQCSFTGMAGGPPNLITGATGYATDGATVLSSSQVSFAHCAFVGGKGWAGTQEFNPWEGGYGLNAFQSSVSLWQCSLTGGAGGDGSADGLATTGGKGAILIGGTTVFDGCTLTGGTGGMGASTWLGGPGGTGGDAALAGGGGRLKLTDTAFVVGAGGPGGIGMFGGPPGAVGAPGGGLIVFNSSVETYEAQARDLTVNSPVRSGQVASFAFGVVSCDAVLLVYSATTQGLWLGGPQGTLIPGLPLGLLSLALPCATGTQPLAATIPALPAGIEGVNLFVQALHVNATTGSQLGPFTVLTLLHPSIP